MTKNRKSYEEFRSYKWFGADDLRAFGHRSRAMQMGYDAADWSGKPRTATRGREIWWERLCETAPNACPDAERAQCA